MADKSNESSVKTWIEGEKLFYDVFKHLTTLSSGSILILVPFSKNYLLTLKQSI
jgi:hypothetical protein